MRTNIFPVVVLLGAGIAYADPHPRISRELDRMGSDAQADVIVRYKPDRSSQRLTRARALGAVHQRSLDLVNAEAFRLTKRQIEVLANDPDVEMISPDHEISAFLDRAAASSNYVQLANYLDGQHMAKGAGVGIAIIDSGMEVNHPNFNGFNTSTSRIVYSESFVSGEPVNDWYGHGTHVAGIAAGADNLTSLSGNALAHWFWGLAPDAAIINLKVLDQNGVGKDSNVIAALNRAVQLKSRYNIRVINLSLGRPVTTSYKSDPLCQAVEAAWKAGIVVVVSAGNFGRDNSNGNSGYGTITAPGNDPYVITVGAVNDKADTDRTNDVIATYSSKGPTAIDHIVKPDLVAPGNRIISYQSGGSNMVKNYPANRPDVDYYFPSAASAPSPHYFQLSGTSMAAPVVAGIAAELLAKTPSLTPDQVKARLMRTAWRGFPSAMSTYDPSTAQTYTAYADIFTIGAGMVDAWAAYNDSTSVTGAAPSPSVYWDSTSKKPKLTLNSIGANTIVWGTSIVWGTTIVWGTNVSGNSVVWGTSLVWGASSVQGFSVIWGTTSPWANSTMSSESLPIGIYGEN